jgi:FlaA1/EpsC-like NDP-sugar epimerase
MAQPRLPSGLKRAANFVWSGRHPERGEVLVEDLLQRAPLQMDRETAGTVVRERCIAVTGAGGSIGSELCREICRLKPARLLLIEKCENNLFLLHREITERHGGVDVSPLIADISDWDRMRRVFDRYRPDVVFHAAAHKHVPMMEWNPGEAVKNNVWGTKIVADLAHSYRAAEFILISSDKAINPSSIMGASKRVAELYIRAMAQRSSTSFMIVRFGNVLGSTGSVIPIFKEQIARGGPVTVTHPDMTRFFMTISEACQLLLQAASMRVQGATFVLDMGKPVRIVDLAKELIRLSGLPEGSIPLSFTGLRPGEKLVEELTLPEERIEKTVHPRILVARGRGTPWSQIRRQVKELRSLADYADEGNIRAKIREIVPEYAGDAPGSVLSLEKRFARIPPSEPIPV